MKVNSKYLAWLIIILVFSLSYKNIIAQNAASDYNEDRILKNFITFKFGAQISGIKSEDFVSKNIAPLLNLNVGRRLTQSIALQIGYKGFYFNTISDNNKHNYGFYYGEVLLNINSLTCNNYNKSNWYSNIHIGSGYFYNNFYNQPNICASMGLSSSFPINNFFALNIEFSAIMGWDIYQGDEDILPNVGIGIVYNF
jgi:hypothetical protein